MIKTELIKPLHGLRGLAALTVVIGHFAPTGAPALGVVLFFVLSGFLIGKLYIEQEFVFENVWRYIVARFARVYPLFAVVIVSTALFNYATGARIFGLDVSDIWIHLALSGDAFTVWTISTEFQFYGLFILVWALRSRLPTALATILPLFLLAAVTAFYIGTNATRIGIPGYLHVFLLGTLTAILTDKAPGSWQTLAARAVPFFVVAYFVAFVAIPFLYTPRWIYLDPVAIAICALFLASTILGRDCLGNRVLSLPIFMWLGEISFGIYLLHRHAQWFVDQLIGHTGIWITLLPKILVTLLLAQLANWLIERPCRDWLRTIGNSRLFGKYYSPKK